MDHLCRCRTHTTSRRRKEGCRATAVGARPGEGVAIGAPSRSRSPVPRRSCSTTASSSRTMPQTLLGLHRCPRCSGPQCRSHRLCGRHAPRRRLCCPALHLPGEAYSHNVLLIIYFSSPSTCMILEFCRVLTKSFLNSSLDQTVLPKFCRWRSALLGGTLPLFSRCDM
jgi:hypothetical protein